jgi:type IV secretion system protein TrbI
VQDNTDNNVQDLKNQLAAEQQRQAQQTGATGDPALATATPAQQAAASRYSSIGQTVPCVPGQPCAQPNIYGQQTGQPSISPQEQEAQQLAAKERELAYNSRFASNLVYTHQPEAAVSQQTPAGGEVPTVAGYSQGLNPNAAASTQTGSSLVAARSAGESTPAAGQETIKHAPEVNIDSAVGQPYVIYEGLTMDTVLMNRLDGDSVGPVKVLVSNPVYSHDGPGEAENDVEKARLSTCRRSFRRMVQPKAAGVSS